MPAHFPDWPSAGQIRTYLQAYADRFHVSPLIRYRTHIESVARAQGSPSGWEVTSSDASGQRTIELFDLVLVCNGTFNIPSQPTLADQELFGSHGGRVLHSTQVRGADELRGKRVVVVGLGKSAIDLAAFAATQANSVHMICRRLHWLVPRFVGKHIHARYVYMSRFWESLMLPLSSPIEPTLSSRVRQGLNTALLRGFETIFAHQFSLDGCGMRPEHPFSLQVSSGFCIAPADFYDHIAAGRIQILRGTISGFVERGVELMDGRVAEADVVIFATGFRQEQSFLDPDVRDRVVDSEGRYRLYRYLLNPEVPDLGFVGYNSSLFTPLTSELGAVWLAEYVCGRLALPPLNAMNTAIDEELKVGKAVRPRSQRFTGINVAPYTFHYLDTLLGDLGCAPRRSLSRRALDFFKPCEPKDYGGYLARLSDEPNGCVGRASV